MIPIDDRATAYRPAYGSEGIYFMEQFCARCARDASFQAGEGDSCIIAAYAVACAVNDPDYPAEWVTNATGPRCTAFEPVETGGAIHDARQAALAV